MKISLIQTDIVWENKDANLKKLENTLNKLSGKSDLVVLPEMFSTGFSMNSYKLAERITEKTINILTYWSQYYHIALTGSYIAKEQESFFNRGFFITPEGNQYFYDKHHLFRMGDEIRYFTAGTGQLIVHYNEFNIALFICYDLRFPVWNRNINNNYDISIYPANWPASRRKVWDILLKARALENMCYVCGVNRIGIDGNGISYDGGSILISPKGDTIATVADNIESNITASVDIDSLMHFRNKFAVWKDADHFRII